MISAATQGQKPAMENCPACGEQAITITIHPISDPSEYPRVNWLCSACHSFGHGTYDFRNGMVLFDGQAPAPDPGAWKAYRKKPIQVKARKVVREEKIETLEGVMTARPGDFVIMGVKGEFYPCKPDIFEKTYEPVREGN